MAITTPILLVIRHPDARIDVAYLCIKFDDFRLSRSTDMIGAPKFCNGSHDLTTPLSRTVCHPKAVTCTFNLYMKFVAFVVAKYEDT